MRQLDQYFVIRLGISRVFTPRCVLHADCNRILCSLCFLVDQNFIFQFVFFSSRAVAAAAMSGVKISFRVLWQFVSEHSPLKPRSQVQKLLEENEEFIRDSLSIYAEGKVSGFGIVILTSCNCILHYYLQLFT